MTTLCDTFRSRACWTWDLLSKARAVNSQIGEETITDLHCLEFKTRHPTEVYTKTFSKREEGENGTDWEWWFTGSSRQWVGFRIQAKLIDFDSNSFRHLHYQNHSGYQSDILLRRALKDKVKRIPLYCLYTQWDSNLVLPHQYLIQTLLRESFGCSLLSSFIVRYLRENERINDLPSLLTYIQPWQNLVCNQYEATYDLPWRAWYSWWFNIVKYETILRQDITTGRDNDDITELYDFYTHIQPIPEPPQYVLDLRKGDLVEQPDSNLRTITIFEERSQ